MRAAPGLQTLPRGLSFVACDQCPFAVINHRHENNLGDPRTLGKQETESKMADLSPGIPATTLHTSGLKTLQPKGRDCQDG